MNESNSDYPDVEKIICKTCKLKNKTLRDSEVPEIKKSTHDVSENKEIRAFMRAKGIDPDNFDLSLEEKYALKREWVNSKKTFHDSTVAEAKKNVPDIKVTGDGDLFKLLAKASSEQEGWMKSTRVMEIPHVGCLVQVTTQQRNPDGSYALSEAVTFVPGVVLLENAAGRCLIKAP